MRRARRRTLLATVLAVGALVAIVVVVTRGGRSPLKPLCRVVAPSGQFELSLDRAANAATIAAIGKSQGMPDHAVTVALAAALQESGLRNLATGDRDSVGLFQQRPSQGWGTEAQLLRPQYSAARFYQALRIIPGWTTLPVAEAAQAVQRSADPSAYAAWEGPARAMAEALTGEVPAGLACQFTPPGGPPSPPSLAQAMQQELGSAALTSSDSGRQWLIAQWLVAHGAGYRITSVSFAGWHWTNNEATWKSATAKGASLTLTVAGSSTPLTSAAAVR